MFLRQGSAILRAPEGDPASGGSGGGGNEPKPLTEEDVGRILNAGITNHLKRLNLDGKIAEAIGGLKLDEKLNGLIESLKKPATDPSGSGDGQPGKPDPEIQRQLSKLAEDLEKEKAARQAAIAEAAEMRRSHEFGTARQKLYESLKPHASETLHDVWVDNLIHHKRLKVEEGTALLEVEFAPAKGMPKQRDFLPLEEAITHLVASEEAKRFQPAPGTEDGKGSPGPRGTTRRGNAPSLDSKNPADRVAARLAGLGIDFDSEFSP